MTACLNLEGFPKSAEFLGGFPKSAEFLGGFPKSAEFLGDFPKSAEFLGDFPSFAATPCSSIILAAKQSRNFAGLPAMPGWVLVAVPHSGLTP